MNSETGIGSPSNPSPNHFAALEREAREFKKQEATRMLLSSPPPGSDLASLAELLKNPQATSKRIAELQAATQKSEAAAAAARRDAEALRHAEANAAMREKASTDKIEREQSEHNAWMQKERSEIESERRTIAKLKSEVEANLAAATKARAEQERRLRIMGGAAA